MLKQPKWQSLGVWLNKIEVSQRRLGQLIKLLPIGVQKVEHRRSSKGE